MEYGWHSPMRLAGGRSRSQSRRLFGRDDVASELYLPPSDGAIDFQAVGVRLTARCTSSAWTPSSSPRHPTPGGMDVEDALLACGRAPLKVNTELLGRSALVTGGASGIGRAIALGLAAEGVNIAIADRADGAATVESAMVHGVRAIQVRVDVSDESEVRRMVDEATEALGTLDLYVNCAAAFAPESVTGITSENWYATIDTNLSACVWACRSVATQFIRQRRGSILVVGSTVARSPSYMGMSYRVSKVGLKSHMETVAIELAPFNIRVNMLSPGAFDTPLVAALPLDQREAVREAVPLGRREARSEEIAASALLLLSDHLSPYTTGADLVVDGGLTLRPLSIGDDVAVRALNETPPSP